MANNFDRTVVVRRLENEPGENVPIRYPTHASTRMLPTQQSRTYGNGWPSPRMQLPALPLTQPPRSRTSIPISQLLIDDVSSPIQSTSAVRSPVSVPSVHDISPLSMNYNSSPIQPCLQLHLLDEQCRHRFDRPPVWHGSSPFVFHGGENSPREPRSCLYPENVGSSAPIRHKSSTSLISSSSNHRDTYTAHPATQQCCASDRAPRLTYGLSIRQQPVAARACGFGERDRRVIDPPPIVELKITNKTTGEPEQDSNAMLALHCTLRDQDGKDVANEAVSPQLDMSHAQRLMGSLVASPYEANDEHGVAGTFFVLPDLSCRAPGKFRLHMKLLRVDPTNMLQGSVHHSVATIMTDIFVVHIAKDFPGMRASSALLRSLRRQGLNVGVKKGSETRNSRSKNKRESSSDGEDAVSGSDVDFGGSSGNDFDTKYKSRQSFAARGTRNRHKAEKKRKSDGRV